MAKKRSRQTHTGSLYFSNPYWYAAVMLHGKRRRVRCGSKDEAKAKLRELVELAQATTHIVGSTFGAFRQRWLEHIRANRSLKTVEQYSYALKPFEGLDPIPLERLTAQAIQSIVDKLTGRTRQQGFDKMKQLLMTAVKWSCLHHNPMVHLERPGHETKTIDPFELTEVEQIITAADSTRYAAAIRLAFACGLRGGELWGLQWSDLQGNELSIQRQACESAGTIEIKSPKTAAGIRRILLPDSVVDSLATKRADSLRLGQVAVPWIFPSEDGTVTRRSNFGARVWRPILTNLQIRPRGFHHARHTAATLLLNSGAVPLSVVSKTLGHASPKITLDTYAHVMTTDLELHRNAFDRVLRHA